MKKIFTAAILTFVILIFQGCNVVPSLTYNYKPSNSISYEPIVKKIAVYKAEDKRPHIGTSPVYKAYIPFYPFVKIFDRPENFVLFYNGNSFDYEMNFAELIAKDIESSNLASSVVTEADKNKKDSCYKVKIELKRLDWQTDYTMYGLSVLGYLPQLFGAPCSYGIVSVAFNLNVLDIDNNILGTKYFSCDINQNGWIYYYSGYLRALTEAYMQISPQVIQFIKNSIADNNTE